LKSLLKLFKLSDLDIKGVGDILQKLLGREQTKCGENNILYVKIAGLVYILVTF
jgi:hypothetical protein